jgi:alpha-mannosidase
MDRYPDYTRERLRLLVETLRTRVYPELHRCEEILVAGPTGRIPYDEAQRLTGFQAARFDEVLGPPWSTWWFRVQASVPVAWDGRPVDLLWDSGSEATLWIDGRVVQGMNPPPVNAPLGARPDAPLRTMARGGETITFQVEMACNQVFGEQDLLRGPQRFALVQCDLAVVDTEAWDLYHDFLVLQGLEAEHAHGLDPAWAGELLAGLNLFANRWDPDDRATWAPSRKILAALLARTNGEQSLVHELSACGHAHMDTAWVWPMAETKRKCVRTFSNALRLMDAYPEYRFACSQAQQYAWIRDEHPELFERIRAQVQAGRFLPVGGMWVEPDCNLISGESLVRQLLLGQRFFQREFGITCREGWLPDIFGYNGQMPQVLSQAGLTRFVTQKLSWNRFNQPLHHTFVWEGIDGSELLTHFPPADTYGAHVTVRELRHNVQNFKDHDRSRESLFLFGLGDGGGGPTRRMLESLRRVRNLQALPRTEIRSIDAFFERLEDDYLDRTRVVGEMYFEYHRGTYTSQAAVKGGNRKAEFLLHDVELLAAVAHRLGKAPYPGDEIDGLWQRLLTLQFHDILPGSSTGEVYADALADLQIIAAKGEALRTAALNALPPGGPPGPSVVNTIAFPREGVVALAEGKLAWAQAPAMGIGRLAETPDAVTLDVRQDCIVLENRNLRATLATDGRLLGLVAGDGGREALAAPGNLLMLYRDEPTQFDAWDIDPFHMETESVCPDADVCVPFDEGPLRAGVRYERRFGSASRMVQTVTLDAGARRLEFACDVDWHESHRVLKVAFPLAVRSMNATYEMQFGVAERPTHFNTKYDLARYEVPGHRWADLSEHGFGVALLSESKYGFSCHDNVIRMTLLRAPCFPDPDADRGRHRFAYALMPHQGGWQEGGVVAEGLDFNVPLRMVDRDLAPGGLFAVDGDTLVLDTVKKAEDDDSLIVRLYEPHGGRGSARLSTRLPFASAHFVDLLERPIGLASVVDGTVEVPFLPFQVISLKLG